MHPAILKHERAQTKTEVPDFRPGDTVRVNLRIKEGERQRIQRFEGIVIRRNRGTVSETFMVRKVSNGVGVERQFLLHSPLIESIEVVRQGKVRRSRLYYLRKLSGKKARVKSRRRPEKAKLVELLAPPPQEEVVPVQAEEVAQPESETAAPDTETTDAAAETEPVAE